MSVLTTMVVVLRHAPTVLVATHVPAMLGTPSMLMAMLVMVCETIIVNGGFEILKSMLHYPDNNECVLNTHLCHHICINTIGSYICDCNVGYMLNSDGLTCSGMYTCTNCEYLTVCGCIPP